MFFFSLLTLALGLVFGSFVAAVTYRVPKGRSFTKGRSNCDSCRKDIIWYDNIPLISYLFLKGKCRFCGNKISARYPVIEFTTATVFILISLFPTLCGSYLKGEFICQAYQSFGILYFPILLALSLILIAIYVVDFETHMIPDEFSFLGLGIIFFSILLLSPSLIFEHLFSGFLMAALILLIHIITKGQGMGLGDVKLALFIGIIFGFPLSNAWLFLGFLTGGLCGIILILVGKAKLKQEVAFGPFLIFAFFLTFFLGNRIFNLVF